MISGLTVQLAAGTFAAIGAQAGQRRRADFLAAVGIGAVVEPTLDSGVLLSRVYTTGQDSTVASADSSAACVVRCASTATMTCPMWVASARDSLVASSGGESKMTMRSG